MIGELMGWDHDFVFLPYGNRWRKLRSLFTQQLSPTNIKKYERPHMQESIYVFLNNLLDTPKKFREHLLFLSGGNIISSAYGIPVNDSNHPFLKLSIKAAHGLAEAGNPGTYLVDVFPMLKYVPSWFPGAGFKRRAAYERNIMERVLREPFEFVQTNMTNGTAKSSIASRLIQKMQDDGEWSEENQDLAMCALGTIFGGGADTTATTTEGIFLALVCNPDILKKGQAAVDAVVGPDRLPDFGDEGKIPYVDAMVMEILRWRPIVPLGVAHYTTSADTYRGYYIPANTIVIGNSWPILHDPTTYGADVSEFRPERFLNSDGTLNRAVPYPDAAFGFGRRVCAGQDFVHSAIWIAVVSLLACFDFAKALDKDGVEIEPSTNYIERFMSYPRPFECTITPRSKAVEELIRKSLEHRD